MLNLLFNPANVLLGAVGLGVLALKIWAIADACLRPGPAFPLNGKLTKPAWIAILVVGLLIGGGNVLGLFGLISIVATIVYLVDVRPVVSGSQPRGPWG